VSSPPQAPVDPLTGMSAARFGVYVHFPYCLSKCPYCDFASVVAKQVPEARYADAVLAELDARCATWPRGRHIDSLYFGGGTPSLWSAARVARVVAGITERLPLAAGAEVTLEANPGAADASRFSEYRAAGVNRLSIGAQSFEPATLAFLGRAHDGAAVEAAFGAARAAGFDNVSLDFI
jgi:coproporphyrinogen III oxidase-like Fe-S oxidoreductase